MGKDVIIACDFADKETALSFIDKFEGRKPFVKIGMELFYAEGPQIVREIKARGHKIFLDLKLHDIPNTVKKSMAVLSRLDVDMCNLHAAGTSRMMEAALEGLTCPDGTRPPAHRRDPADLHRSGGDGARSSDKRAHRQSCHALRRDREERGT